MTTVISPRVRRVSDTEIVVAAPRDVAIEHVADAIAKLGTVKERGPDNSFVVGRVRFGWRSVAMRVSLVERDPGQTSLVMQVSSDDVWGSGARSASKRLVQTLENLDNPGFKPDRLGMNPRALVAVTIGFGILVWLIMELIMEPIMEHFGIR